MNLTDFLLTASADNNVALAEAKAYTTTKVWRIEGAERKTSVETVVIVNDTTDRLTDAIATLKALPEPTPTEAGQLVLSKAILRALGNLYNPEFYINLADTEVAGMFSNAQALGVLTAAEIAGITTAATYNETPFDSTTLEQVRAIRQPPQWLDCDHGGQAHVVSASYQDTFTFSATLVEEVDNISIRCYWATAVGAQEYLAQRKTNITGQDALFVSQSFSRASMGLPSTARILRFEFISAYDGVVSSVSVSK